MWRCLFFRVLPMTLLVCDKNISDEINKVQLETLSEKKMRWFLLTNRSPSRNVFFSDILNQTLIMIEYQIMLKKRRVLEPGFFFCLRHKVIDSLVQNTCRNISKNSERRTKSSQPKAQPSRIPYYQPTVLKRKEFQYQTSLVK